MTKELTEEWQLIENGFLTKFRRKRFDSLSYRVLILPYSGNWSCLSFVKDQGRCELISEAWIRGADLKKFAYVSERMKYPRPFVPEVVVQANEIETDLFDQLGNLLESKVDDGEYNENIILDGDWLEIHKGMKSRRIIFDFDAWSELDSPVTQLIDLLNKS